MLLPGVLVEVLVGVVWGCTNPFIRRAAKAGGEEGGGAAPGAAGTVLRLAKRFWPLALNLSASLLFFLSLSAVEVSLAVPLSNATTFLCTALVGHALGERLRWPLVAPGAALTVLGIYLCISS